jgi:hypothetical protein
MSEKPIFDVDTKLGKARFVFQSERECIITSPLRNETHGFIADTAIHVDSDTPVLLNMSMYFDNGQWATTSFTNMRRFNDDMLLTQKQFDMVLAEITRCFHALVTPVILAKARLAQLERQDELDKKKMEDLTSQIAQLKQQREDVALAIELAHHQLQEALMDEESLKKRKSR